MRRDRAPLLSTQGEKQVLALDRLNPQRIYVLGGTAVISTAVAAALAECRRWIAAKLPS